MIGSKFYDILNTLNNSDKRSLTNLCKRHEDKRYNALSQLLKNKLKTKEEFSLLLEDISYEISPDSQEEKERKKNLRRFVDFACKTIENFKLQEFLTKDAKTRNFLLSQVFGETEKNNLKKHYLSKAEAISKNDYWIEMSMINNNISSMFKSHVIKDLEGWKHLVKNKYNAVNKYYQLEMAKIYDDVSRSFLDDDRSEEIFGPYFKDGNNINSVIQTANRNVERVYYRLAQARFCFNDPTRFHELIGIIKLHLKEGIEDEKERIILERKYLFIQFLFNFHFGEEPKKLLEFLDQIIEIDRKQKTFDSKMIFYHHGLKAILNESTKELRDEFDYLFQKDQTGFLNDFTIALEHLEKGELKLAKAIFSELSYCKNPFVAIWSRIGEIVINLNQGNMGLCEHLIQRCKRQIKNNQSRIFSRSSSVNTLNDICTKLGLPLLKLEVSSTQDKNTYTCYHLYFLNKLK